MSQGSDALLEHVVSLGVSPLLPVWLLSALGLLSAIALGAGLWQRAAGTSWRLACTALVLLWLSGPHLLRASWQDLPQTALLVVDQSGSMHIGARAAIASRAADILRARAQALHDRAGGIRLRTVIVPPSSPAQGGGGTRLFDAIARASADIPADQLSGVIALTDGQVHDAPAAGASPGRAGATGRTQAAPLQALITASGEQTDRRLRVLQAPPFAIVGQDVTLRVEVDDLGPAPAAGHATLSLRREGKPVESRDVPLGVPQDITLPVEHPGPMLLQLDASSLPGEVSALNNRAVVEINAVRDRLRVLLVSGAPNQGERVWRRLLKADPAVDLVHFTILRPPDKDDTTPLNELALIAFPTRELFQEKIGSFDLIILDGFENRGILPLAYLQNIADFVRGGGGLLVTTGPEFLGRNSLQDTPLGDILPAHVPQTGGLIEERFQPTPTKLGRRHPVTAGLPQMPPTQGGGGWGPWFRALQPDDSHGEVLLTTPDPRGAPSPLLLLDHVDQGRAALLLSDQIWLWSRGEDGGGPQAELLRRIAHWLMKEPQLEEEQLSARIQGGVLTVTRRSVDEHPTTRITLTPPAPPGGAIDGIAQDGAGGVQGGTEAAAGAPPATAQTLHLSPQQDGTWSASAPAQAPGIWDASDGVRHAYAASQPEDPVELADLRATASQMGPAAREARGGVVWLGDDPDRLHVPELRLVEPGAAASGPGWIGLRRTGAHIVTGSETTRLLPAWLVLPLALLLLLTAWWREGAKGP